MVVNAYHLGLQFSPWFFLSQMQLVRSLFPGYGGQCLSSWQAIGTQKDCELLEKCVDDPLFKDSAFHSCQEWLGHDCSSGGKGVHGLGVHLLLARCPRSCGLCGSTDAAKLPPWSPATASPNMTLNRAATLDVEFHQNLVTAPALRQGNVEAPRILSSNTGLANAFRLTSAPYPSQWSQYFVLIGNATSSELYTLCQDDDIFRDMGSRACTDWRNIDCGRGGWGVHGPGIHVLIARCPRTCHDCENVTFVTTATSTTMGFLPYDAIGPETNQQLITSCRDDLNYRYKDLGLSCSALGRQSSCNAGWAMSRAHERLVIATAIVRCPFTCKQCRLSSAQSIGNDTDSELLKDCRDDVDFIDAVGHNCAAWLQHDCTNTSGPSSSQRQARCPKSCELCKGPATSDNATLFSTCRDDQMFIDEQGFRCKDWSGDCTGPRVRWYSSLGATALLNRCPYSCHLCVKPYHNKSNKTDSELLSTCEDDVHFISQMHFTGPHRRRQDPYYYTSCLMGMGFGCDFLERNLSKSFSLTAAGAIEFRKRCPHTCGLCVQSIGRPSDGSSPSPSTCVDQSSHFFKHFCDSWGASFKVWSHDCQRSEINDVFLVRYGWFVSFDYVKALRENCPRTCGSCNRCQPGYTLNYSSTPYQSSFCIQCAPGNFSTSGWLPCQRCAAGTYSSKDRTQCNYCREHQYNDQQGMSACENCPQYSLAPGTGNVECVADFGAYRVNPRSSNSYQFSRCGTLKTTLQLGAMSNKSCICSAGSFYNRHVGECRLCPTGMQCPGDTMRLGDARPFTKFGFSSFDVSDDYVVFKCIPKGGCLGNGTCVPGSDIDAPACGSCLPGHYRLGDDCQKCEIGDKLMACTLCILAIMILTAYVGRISSASLLLRRSPKVEVVMFGIAISVLQSFTVLDTLEIDWTELWQEVFGVSSVFNIDFHRLRIRCLFGNLAVKIGVQYACRLSGFPFVAVLLAIFISAKQVLRHERHQKCRYTVNEIYNAWGTVFLIFLVCLCTIAFAPFHCYEHPTPGYESVRRYPAVLCWKSSGQHTSMLVSAVLACTLILAPGVAMSLWATWRYPGAALCGDHEFFHAHQFLFVRLKPDCYTAAFPMAMRSIVLALAPVCLPRDGSCHITFVVSLYLVSAMLVCSLRPWRIELANHVDAATCGIIVLLLTCGALTSDVEGDQHLSEYTVFTVLIMLAIVFLVIVLRGVLRRCKHQRFSHFICHYKVENATQARALQQLLESATGQPCFIDSDHLVDLSTLFDTVRDGVRNLVVYLGRLTMTRPWCVGEMYTACDHNIHIIAVHTAQFQPMSENQLANLSKILGNGVEVLSRHAMGIQKAAAALRKVQSLDFIAVPNVVSPKSLYGLAGDILQRSVGGSVFGHNHAATFHATAKHVEFPSASILQSSVFVCSAIEDAEASAAGLLLSIHITKTDLGIQSVFLMANTPDLSVYEVCEFTTHAQYKILLLSNAALTSLNCATVVCFAWLQPQRSEIVTVTLPEFRFPADDFYESGCSKLFVRFECALQFAKPDEESVRRKSFSLREDLIKKVNVEVFQRAFKDLFNYIAVSMNTHASISTIKTTVEQIASRCSSNAELDLTEDLATEAVGIANLVSTAVTKNKTMGTMCATLTMGAAPSQTHSSNCNVIDDRANTDPEIAVADFCKRRLVDATATESTRGEIDDRSEVGIGVVQVEHRSASRWRTHLLQPEIDSDTTVEIMTAVKPAMVGASESSS